MTPLKNRRGRMIYLLFLENHDKMQDFSALYSVKNCGRYTGKNHGKMLYFSQKKSHFFLIMGDQAKIALNIVTQKCYAKQAIIFIGLIWKLIKQFNHGKCNFG